MEIGRLWKIFSQVIKFLTISLKALLLVFAFGSLILRHNLMSLDALKAIWQKISPTINGTNLILKDLLRNALT
jgi:hypothetical protein